MKNNYDGIINRYIQHFQEIYHEKKSDNILHKSTKLLLDTDDLNHL